MVIFVEKLQKMLLFGMRFFVGMDIVGLAVEPVEYRHGASTEVVKNDLQRGFGNGILKQGGLGVDSPTLAAGDYEYHVTAPAGKIFPSS